MLEWIYQLMLGQQSTLPLLNMTRFQVNCTGDMCIDEMTVTTCVANPTFFINGNNVTATSADLGWIENGSCSGRYLWMLL